MSTPVKLRMSPRLRGRASSSPAASAQSNDHHPPAGEQQNSRPDKLFSEEDEIRLLKSLSKLNNPSSPTADSPALDRIEKSLGPNFTRAQLSNKIRRLRYKYHKQARTKALIRTPHDRKVFELARDVWGKRSARKERRGKEEKEASLEEEKERDEGEILGDEDESKRVVVDLGNFPALMEECNKCFPGNGLWREGLQKVKEGRLRMMNERVVWLRLEEATVMAKKAELTQDLTRMILDSVASSSQAPTA